MALYCILMDRQYILIDTPLSSLEDNKKGGSALPIGGLNGQRNRAANDGAG